MSFFAALQMHNALNRRRRLIRYYLDAAGRRATTTEIEQMEFPEGMPEELKDILRQSVLKIRNEGGKNIQVHVLHQDEEGDIAAVDPKIRH